MKVYELINKLQALKPELLVKDVIIRCPNGLEVEPKIKIVLNENFDIESGVKNVIITWE